MPGTRVGANTPGTLPCSALPTVPCAVPPPGLCPPSAPPRRSVTAG